MKTETTKNVKEIFEIRKETFGCFEEIVNDVERNEKYYTERLETEKQKASEIDASDEWAKRDNENTQHYCEIKLKALANIKLALIELSEKI